MRSILTPTTVYRHRVKLMSKLLALKGDLSRQKDRGDFVKKNRSTKLVLDFGDKEEWKEKLSPSFSKIIKFWKRRAKTQITYRSQVAGLMEQVCLPNCEFCGANWGLKCETIDSIEEVFHKFLDYSYALGKDYDISNWNLEDWQGYFLKNVVFRTSCYSCYKLMLPQPSQSWRYFAD